MLNKLVGINPLYSAIPSTIRVLLILMVLLLQVEKMQARRELRRPLGSVKVIVTSRYRANFCSFSASASWRMTNKSFLLLLPREGRSKPHNVSIGSSVIRSVIPTVSYSVRFGAAVAGSEFMIHRHQCATLVLYRMIGFNE